MKDLQSEASDMQSSHQLPYSLQGIPEWLLYPEELDEQPTETVKELGKLKLKFDLKRKLRLRKYNKTRGFPYKRRSHYPKYRWCPKPLTVKQMYDVGVIPHDQRIPIFRKPQVKMTADASDSFS